MPKLALAHNADAAEVGNVTIAPRARAQVTKPTARVGNVRICAVPRMIATF
jgi:hypothetical protein